MNKELFVKGINGFVMLALIIAGIIISILLFFSMVSIVGVLLFIVSVFCFGGFAMIAPNQALVLNLFGKYNGTINENGFVWVNPFNMKRIISLRASNLSSEHIKVNDKMGNPIMISAVMVWRVKDTYKALYDVDSYSRFVDVQIETAIRNLAASYCYDNMESNQDEITLRGGGEEVNDVLETALRDRLSMAGVEVIEARISNLAYAPEIAGAMLQRQQATAVVAARAKIVEGAVGMVEMALKMLSEKEIVEFDPERKAAMVSNLMVVLTADRSVTPVVNTGTLYN